MDKKRWCESFRKEVWRLPGKNNREWGRKDQDKKIFFFYRLEKLCRGDGGKVGIVINDVVSAFFLNSSLVPGRPRVLNSSLVPGRHRELFSGSR